MEADLARRDILMAAGDMVSQNAFGRQACVMMANMFRCVVHCFLKSAAIMATDVNHGRNVGAA